MDTTPPRTAQAGFALGLPAVRPVLQPPVTIKPPPLASPLEAQIDRAVAVTHAHVGDPKSAGYGRYVLGGTAGSTLIGAAYGALAIGGAADALVYGVLACFAATVAIPLSVVALDIVVQVRRRRKMLAELARFKMPEPPQQVPPLQINNV